MLITLIVFIAVYVGMALGRWPGLKVDRAGIALLGAITLYVLGQIGGEQALAAMDFATLFILFGLMILSAQFAASGFYDWCSSRIATAAGSPTRLLAITVAVAGLLSAVLANDVVVFAMTPLLCHGLRARGLDARPYLIALAGAANAGSAATMIGNPQNILIAQFGGLDFWAFARVCAMPAVLGLCSVFIVVWVVWRKRFRPHVVTLAAPPPVVLDRWQLGKSALATLMLLVLFTTPLPHATGVLAVAGVMLMSRRLASRQMLGMVDWHLLVLFAGLFVVTAALANTGLTARAVESLRAVGWAPDRLAVLAPLALAGSNTIGNVPLVMLLLTAWQPVADNVLYVLAVFSTLAGNFLLVGSLANLIVVEQARDAGVILGFREHARCGVPMTLLSFALAAGWMTLMA